MTSPCN